jgi:hypothetical protein
MYDCKIFNEELKHTVTFKVLSNFTDTVLVERFSETGVLLSTATDNAGADNMKENFLAEGFTEL